MDESRRAKAASISPSAVNRIPVRSISLAIVVAVLLYAGMVTLADWEAFAAAVASLPAWLWLQVVALSMLSYLLRFARWHHFINALGHQPPILRHLEVYLAGFALTLTPGKAGETVRSVYLHPYGVSYPHSLGTFVSERLMDLIAVGALSLLGLSMHAEQRLWMLYAMGGIVLVFFLIRSHLLGFVAKRAMKNSSVDHAARLIAAVRFLLTGRRFALSGPLSLMAWGAQGLSLYTIVHALGYSLEASTVIAIYCLSILAGAASFIPGGLGATEAAIVLLLSSAGLSHTDAMTTALISRGLTLWLAVAIGVAAMTKAALSVGSSGAGSS